MRGRVALAGAAPRLLFLCVLFLAAALRLYGIDWGTDRASEQHFYRLHPDEQTLVDAAAALGQTLKPATTAYGALPMYLLYALGRPLAWVGGMDLFVWSAVDSMRGTYIIARFLSTVFSLLTLWIVYRLGRDIASERAGLLAAAFFAFAALSIQLAHFYTVDGLFVLLAMWALLLAVRIVQRGAWCDYLWAGVAVGLAAATRMNGMALLAPLALAHVLCLRQQTGAVQWAQLVQAKIWGLGGVAVFALLLLQPYMLLDPGHYFALSGGGNLLMSISIARGETPRTWTLYDGAQLGYWFHLGNLLYYGVGPLLQVSGLLGIVYMAWQRRTCALIILLWVALYFLSIGHLTAKNVRYMAPLIPCWSLAAGVLGAAVWNSQRWRPAGALISGVVLLCTALYALGFTSLYGRQDSRIGALYALREWVPAGASIGVEATGIGLRQVAAGSEYPQVPLRAGYAFSLDRFVLDAQKVHALFEPLFKVEALGVADAGRGVHFIAACSEYPILCDFYKKLHAGELGFAPVASFVNRPGLWGFEWSDRAAEPSFYAFEHPGIALFSRRATEGELLEVRDGWMRRVVADDGLLDVHIYRAALALRQGDMAAALAACDAALIRRPNHVIPLFMRYEVYHRQGLSEKRDAAWVDIERSVGLHWRGFLWDYQYEGFFQTASALIAYGAREAARVGLDIAAQSASGELRTRVAEVYMQQSMGDAEKERWRSELGL